MFNIIKWAYNLGVQQERQRIAAMLQDNRHGWEMIRTEYWRQEKMSGKDHVKVEVASVVYDLISDLFKPQFDKEFEYFNKMYPRENKR